MTQFKYIDCSPFGNDGFIVFSGETSSSRDNAVWDLSLTEDSATDVTFRCRFSAKAMEAQFGIVGPFIPQQQTGGMVIGKIYKNNPTIRLEVRGHTDVKLEKDVYLTFMFLPLDSQMDDKAIVDLWRDKNELELQSLPRIRFRFRREEKPVDERFCVQKVIDKKPNKTSRNWSSMEIFLMTMVAFFVILIVLFLAVKLSEGAYRIAEDWLHHFFTSLQ